MIEDSAGTELAITVLRDGRELELHAIPTEKDSKGQIGIKSKLAIQRFGFFRAIYQGTILTGVVTVRICQVLYALLTRGEILSALGSPIRITQELTQEVYRGYIIFLQSLSFISIGLAIINLIPLPPLDGGRILLLGVEAVLRKPVDREKLIWIQAVGFLLLMSLMIYLIVVDIQRLIPTGMRL